MTVVYVILILGVLYGLVTLWDTIKAKITSAADTNGTAAKAVRAGETMSYGFHWILQKGLGLLVLALAGLIFYSGPDSFSVVAGMILFLGYGIYLLWPGTRSFWIIF